jgi:hypothetical protein
MHGLCVSACVCCGCKLASCWLPHLQLIDLCISWRELKDAAGQQGHVSAAELGLQLAILQTEELATLAVTPAALASMLARTTRSINLSSLASSAHNLLLLLLLFTEFRAGPKHEIVLIAASGCQLRLAK